VAKALDLLTALADADRPLKLTELAARVGLHRATAYRSLGELLAKGFVSRDQEDRYLLGWAFVRITAGRAARHGLAELAQPTIAQLAERTDRIASLQVLEYAGCRVAEIARAPRYWGFIRYAGQTIEPWRSAAGMILLAYSATQQVQHFFAAAASAGIEPAGLRAELDEVRRQGYAHYSGRLDPGLAHVAVPVSGSDGSCLAAVSVSGFVTDFDDRFASSALRAAREAAAEIEGRLGS
jgi:IclR family acetate operon transcriptional repressor